MPFLDLLPQERVRTDLVASDKASLIARLAAPLAGGGGGLAGGAKGRA